MKSLPALRLTAIVVQTLVVSAIVVSVGSARAEESAPSTIGEAIGKLFEDVNLRTPPSAPADFVVRSRPAELDYAPLATPGAQPTKKKNAKEIRSLQKELGDAAAANRSRAARVKVPDAPSKPRASAATRGSAAQKD